MEVEIEGEGKEEAALVTRMVVEVEIEGEGKEKASMAVQSSSWRCLLET